MALGVLAAVLGIVLRFHTTSPLWLDEALSVDISRLPLGDIPAALRRDGHPPLYYVVLHLWTGVFGEGDTAVRALSGLWSLALLPLLWVAGRRVGGPRTAGLAVLLVAVNPWAIRYATEARMYSMLAVLVLAGWLVGTDALRRPTPGRLIAITLLTTAALWTHYWALWFLGTVTIASTLGLIHRRRSDRRSRDETAERRLRDEPVARVLAAIVGGGLLFLPWLPSLLHQSRHTGTPWARPMRPAEIVVRTVETLGGDPVFAESMLTGWILVVFGLVGLFGVATARREITLDLRTRRAGRPLAILIAGPLALGCIAGYLTGATYEARYAAVIFPFVMLLVALGLAQLRSRAIAFGAVAVVVLLSALGSVPNMIKARSAARVNAQAIAEVADPGDLVLFCPDQLGPSGARELPEDLRIVTHPELGDPDLVDWTDYLDRLDAVDPAAFADRVIDLSGGSRIFVVRSSNYRTHETACEEVVTELRRHRPISQLREEGDEYERAEVLMLEPA